MGTNHSKLKLKVNTHTHTHTHTHIYIYITNVPKALTKVLKPYPDKHCKHNQEFIKTTSKYL